MRILLVLAICTVFLFSFSGSALAQGAGTAEANPNASDVESLIYTTAISIGGWIVGFGGNLFDITIEKVVLKMGCWFVEASASNSGCDGQTGSLGGVVNDLWSVIRDLFNILFIFGLVFIGLQTILNSEDSGTKKALGMLIAAALLINFSLYAAKVVVDVSNYTAVSIYSVASSGISGTFEVKSKDGSGPTTIEVGNETAPSLTGAFMETMRISSFFSERMVAGKIILFSIVALFFLTLLGVIFVYGAIMLIGRFIALIILMIFSPVMFLGWIFPQFSKYSAQWRGLFISYAFFAPSYIFMLYLSLYSMVQVKTGFAEMAYSDAFRDSNPDSFSIFMFFAIGAGFLIASVKVASLMSVAGSNSAMGAVTGLKNRITGGALYGKNKMVGGVKYGAGYGASAATGWASRGVGGWMDNRSAKSNKPRSRLGQSVRSGVLRGENKKWGGTHSSKERGDADTAEAKRHASAHHAYDTQQAIISAQTSIERETATAKADSATLIEMTKTGTGRQALYDNAASISDDKIKDIMKSDDVTPEVKQKLSTYRQEQVSDNLIDEHNPGGTIEDVIHKASTSELKTIGFDTAYENASLLSTKQIEDWKDLTPSQKRYLKKKRGDDLNDIFRDTRGPSKIFNRFKNDTERSKLPKEILINPGSTLYLNRNVLTKIVDNEGIADTDRITIRQNIETRFPAGTPEGDEWRKWFNKNNAGQRY